MIIKIPKDCLSCSKSLITDDDELYCPIKKRIVQEDEYCKEYN